MTRLLIIDGKRSRLLFAGCLILPFIIGIFSSFFLYDAPDIYANLRKPAFSPPYWLIISLLPVISLFTGYASYRVAVSGTHRHDVRIAITFYAAYLVTAFAWPALFFGFENQGLALYVLFVILMLQTASIYSFLYVDKISAYLLLPGFTFWCYITIVNYGITLMQKSAAMAAFMQKS